jgi:hypothetical protein
VFPHLAQWHARYFSNHEFSVSWLYCHAKERRTFLVFLLGAAHNDVQCVIGQRPLQRLRLIPRRAQPDVALFLGGQDALTSSPALKAIAASRMGIR